MLSFLPDLYESKGFIRKFIIRITFIFCFLPDLYQSQNFVQKGRLAIVAFFISQNFTVVIVFVLIRISL